MLIAAVFLVIFAAFAFFMLAATAKSAEERKRLIGRFEHMAVHRYGINVEAAPSVVRDEEVFSSIPWLDRMLRKADITQRLKLLLYQADLEWTVGRLALTAMLLALVGGVLVHMRTNALPAAFGVGAACGAAPFLLMMYRRSRRLEEIRQLLPDALDQIVAAIRAGHSLMSAMGQTAKETPEPLRRELRQCFEEQNYGLDLRVAMENLAYRVPVGDTRIIATAVLIQRDTGGNLTEILEKVAYLIRQEFRLYRQIRVHTAQGRLTGWILSLLPVGVGVLVYLISPQHISILWTRPAGLKMLYGAVTMEFIGALIIRKIIRIRV